MESVVGFVFFFYAECGVGYGAKSFFGYEFARGSADAVCLVVNAFKGLAEMAYELALTLGKTCVRFTFESACAFFEGF